MTDACGLGSTVPAHDKTPARDATDFINSDLKEFFGFFGSEEHRIQEIISWYLNYHGYANWGHFEIIFNRLKKLLGAEGSGLDFADVLGGDGEFRNSFLDRVSPQSLCEYFEAAEPPATKTELLAESENEWRDESLPKPINARLHMSRRPAFNLYEVRGHSLFVAPYGYQAFDPDAGTYWPAVSSRKFTKSIQQYPNVHVASPIVIIQDSFDGSNFAHFLFDWLPRIIFFAKVRPDFARECRFILGGVQGAFQDEVLRRVAGRYKIPLEHFVFPTERVVLKLKGPLFYFSDQKEFIMHPLNMCHKTTISYVKDLFNDLPKPSIDRGNLYISRRDAALRKLTNEDFLAASLREIGYADITLNKLEIIDQMSIFAYSRSVVAPHGMGLTHLIFSSGNTELLELFNPNIGSDAYAFIAKAIGIRYRFLMGDPVRNSSDYTIDIDRVLNSLRRDDESGTAPPAPKVFDPFGFLLENPDHRDYALLNSEIEYTSKDFSREIYEESRGKSFPADEQAYRDWVEFGRAEGLFYNEGKNTYLKIILKVKDDPELITNWIEYHAGIVGYHNLVIMDCGSTDIEFLQILDRYKYKLLILKYEGYYDDLHATQSNRALFAALAKNCKYVTLLDSDEFLFGYHNGKISAKNVVAVLKAGNEKIYAGGWFHNVNMPAEKDGSIDWNTPLTFSLQSDDIKWAAFAGKSVMLSRIAFEAQHLGHNLHVKEVISFLTPNSFGKIGVFHITLLSPRLQRTRALKHLRAKGVVPPDVVSEQDVDQWLTAALEKGGQEPIVENYIKKCLNPPPPTQPLVSFTTQILGSDDEQVDDVFSRAVEAFDYTSLLNESAASFDLPAFPPSADRKA
jgi:hypothetical protein